MFAGHDGAPRVHGVSPEGQPGMRAALVETAALPGITIRAIAEQFGWSVASVHREIAAGLREMHDQLRRAGALTDVTPTE